MIDTWARHLAALREARRLTAMILANNPAFAALDGGVQRSGGAAAGDRTALESALENDSVYHAYGHLSAALALLEPAHASPTGMTLADAVTLLPAPAFGLNPSAGIPGAVALFAGHETSGGPERDASQRSFDEARVSIICGERGAGSPSSPLLTSTGAVPGLMRRLADR